MPDESILQSLDPSFASSIQQVHRDNNPGDESQKAKPDDEIFQAGRLEPIPQRVDLLLRDLVRLLIAEYFE